MRVVRSALLWASTNEWLASRLPQWRVTRRAVTRFMPGQTLEAALGAAARLAEASLPTVVTQLGENVTDADEAGAVVVHYLAALDHITAAGVDCQLSIKPTHLGLDVDPDLCASGVRRLVSAAAQRGTMVWIDMESSAYTDATIELFRDVRRDSANVGLCLQANLRRTEADLAALLPLAPSIRLVKGAYAEPGDVAWVRKRNVDDAFFRLAQQLLRQRSGADAGTLGIATHDAALVSRIAAEAKSLGCSRTDFEVQMLYGIRTAMQHRLVDDGFRVRVLISYGSHWFPWYMRRLAERPANVWFVARAAFAR
jgi:proline dehydrogenase